MSDEQNPHPASEPQTREEYLRSFPPVVYVPTTDETEPTHRRVVMHTLTDGRVAVFVYSAPDRLASFYLPDAAWVLLDVEALQRLHDETPYDLILLDRDPGLQDRSGGHDG